MLHLFNPAEPRANRTAAGFPPDRSIVAAWPHLAVPEFYRLDAGPLDAPYGWAGGTHLLRRVWATPYASFPPAASDRGRRRLLHDDDDFSTVSPTQSRPLWATESYQPGTDELPFRWWLGRLPFQFAGVDGDPPINAWFGPYDWGPTAPLFGAPEVAEHAWYPDLRYVDPLQPLREIVRSDAALAMPARTIVGFPDRLTVSPWWP